MAQTSTLALDYRRPVRVDAARLSLTAAVVGRERAYQMAAWGMLAGGGAALLLGPVIATAIVVMIHPDSIRPGPVGTAAVLALACGSIIPLLFWFERLTRGLWLDEGLGTIRPVPVGGVLELLLWGPRTVLAAIWRKRQAIAANVLTDATATIAYLRHFADDGVGANELPTIQPEPVLRYLESRKWVGISPDGRRVWLLPHARRALGFEAN